MDDAEPTPGVAASPLTLLPSGSELLTHTPVTGHESRHRSTGGLVAGGDGGQGRIGHITVSYTHLTLPTTPYV